MAATSFRRLVSNTILNIAAQVLQAVIGFLLVDFFLRTIGEDGYGVWVLIGSVFSYRQIMTMGLNSAVNRYIPVHIANGDVEGIKQVVSTTFAYFLVPSLILAATTLVVYANVEDWLTVPPEYMSDARSLTLIVGFTFALALPLQVYQAVLSSYQRYDLINYPTVAAVLIRTALVVYLLDHGHGLISLGLIYGASEISIRLFETYYSVRLSGGFQLSPRAVSMKFFREMFGYGMNSLLYVTGALLVFQLAKVVLGTLVSAAAVSRFHVATMPILLLITGVQVFASAMKPAVSDLDAHDEHARIEEMALLVQKYTGILILVSVAFLVVLGRPFMQIWVGDRYDDPVVVAELSAILMALALGSGTRLTQHSNFIVLVGKGDHRFFGVVGVATVVTAVAGSVAAVQLLGGGAVAVAWACAVPMIFFSLTALPLHFMRKLDVSLEKTLASSWLPVVRAVLPAIVLLVAWQNVHSPDSWLELLSAAASAGAIALVSAYFFSTTQRERARFRSLLSRRGASTADRG